MKRLRSIVDLREELMLDEKYIEYARRQLACKFGEHILSEGLFTETGDEYLVGKRIEFELYVTSRDKLNDILSDIRAIAINYPRLERDMEKLSKKIIGE